MDNVLTEIKAKWDKHFAWVDKEIKRLNSMTDIEYVKSITFAEIGGENK